MEKNQSTIGDLWKISDQKNLEILENPLKDPLHFLRLVLFYGMTKKDFQKE
ncbi:hypothetical protein GW927_00225 [Candidatus Pacearchaeota archaeon]|nr:hypothetical protein [Candidatus Pacearchaeota archaeon]